MTLRDQSHLGPVPAFSALKMTEVRVLEWVAILSDPARELENQFRPEREEYSLQIHFGHTGAKLQGSDYAWTMSHGFSMGPPAEEPTAGLPPNRFERLAIRVSATFSLSDKTPQNAFNLALIGQCVSMLNGGARTLITQLTSQMPLGAFSAPILNPRIYLIGENAQELVASLQRLIAERG